MAKNDLKYWREKLKDIVSPELIDDVIVDVNNIHSKQLALMAKKNKDYGNTLYKGCNAVGPIYAFCRIFDKANRFISIFKNQGVVEIADETIEDTIVDLANYCNMYLAWKSSKENHYTSLKYELRFCRGKIYSENKNNDVTKEIINSYDMNNLYADENGFVYTLNADNTYTIITDKNGNQCTYIAKENLITSPMIELYHIIKNKCVRLIEENSGKDVTEEIITDYGLNGLCKDNNDYVYDTTIAKNHIPVISRHKEKVKVVNNKN